MRLNFCNITRGSRKAALVQHLLQLVAQEYDCAQGDLWKQLKTGHEPLGLTVTQCLNNLGWPVTWYKLSHPDHRVDRYGELVDCESVSLGWWIDDQSEALVEWQLQNQ